MPRHFKTKEGYEKSMAYIHMHGVPHKKHDYVYVAGEKHKVKHSKEHKFKF